MYSPIRRNTRKQGNTSFFDRKLSSSNEKLEKRKNRQVIIKEEGSKEEDRQKEADVKNLFVKNGYADLKRRHQNAKIRKIFKWADRGKH